MENYSLLNTYGSHTNHVLPLPVDDRKKTTNLYFPLTVPSSYTFYHTSHLLHFTNPDFLSMLDTTSWFFPFHFACSLSHLASNLDRWLDLPIPQLSVSRNQTTQKLPVQFLRGKLITSWKKNRLNWNSFHE